MNQIEKQINKHVRCRKDYRRKPKSRRWDYMRRQKNGQWLETHVWFAKRFHMILKDGYKLPKSSHDKTYKACYRAIGNHCLAQVKVNVEFCCIYIYNVILF